MEGSSGPVVGLREWSIGTAVLSVILASALTSNLGGHGHATIGGAAALPPGVREKIAPPMAAAFGQTFWWALALIVVALAGSLALPRQKPELTADQADAAPVPLG